MIRLVLPREIQSGNALAYAHWRNRTKDRKAWELLIRAACCRPDGLRIKRSVTVTAYRGRLLDDDNLSSGCKHLRDALVRAGLLIDDCRAWSSWAYVQRLRSHPENPMPKMTCTNIVIIAS
jgi:hypothetical protein